RAPRIPRARRERTGVRMAGLRFLGRTAPRHPGGGSGSGSGALATPSLGAGRGFEARVAPIFRTLLGGHVAIIGRTGCGKTTLARILAATSPNTIIVDWDGEYVDLGLPVMEPPFLLPDTDLAALVSNLERPREGGHGIAAALQVAAELNNEAEPTTLEEFFKLLRRYAFQGAAPQWVHAALARLAVLRKYCVLGVDVSPPLVYYLSKITSVRERAIIQQAIATAVVLSRPLNPPDEILLVIEEGAMGATAEYLKDLIVLSRRRNTKLIWISQSLPPTELLTSFTLLIGDPGPLRHEWSRLLGLPIPELRRGEFLLYDGKTVRKVRVT
ncbi:MAG: DUF87 domain-containing protein, partial [Thermofilaceae archaeon]